MGRVAPLQAVLSGYNHSERLLLGDPVNCGAWCYGGNGFAVSRGLLAAWPEMRLDACLNESQSLHGDVWLGSCASSIGISCKRSMAGFWGLSFGGRKAYLNSTNLRFDRL